MTEKQKTNIKIEIVELSEKIKSRWIWSIVNSILGYGMPLLLIVAFMQHWSIADLQLKLNQRIVEIL